MRKQFFRTSDNHQEIFLNCFGPFRNSFILIVGVFLCYLSFSFFFFLFLKIQFSVLLPEPKAVYSVAFSPVRYVGLLHSSVGSLKFTWIKTLLCYLPWNECSDIFWNSFFYNSLFVLSTHNLALQMRHVFLLLCQFVNYMEVQKLPVYYPSQQEKDDPKLYAENVRKLMAHEVTFLMQFTWLDNIYVWFRKIINNHYRIPVPGPTFFLGYSS